MYAKEDYLALNPNFIITRVNEDTAKFKGDFSEGSGLISVMALTSQPIKNLIIQSNGGLMTEAIMLGKLIKAANMNVIVEENTMCVSACAFAVMTSKNIELHGKLVFHTPYYPAVSSEMTLYELSRSSSLMTLELSHWFIENGFSLKLLKIIYDQTNNEKFMVFTDSDDLMSFKSEDYMFLPENYTEKYEILDEKVIFK